VVLTEDAWLSSCLHISPANFPVHDCLSLVQTHPPQRHKVTKAHKVSIRFRSRSMPAITALLPAYNELPRAAWSCVPAPYADDGSSDTTAALAGTEVLRSERARERPWMAIRS